MKETLAFLGPSGSFSEEAALSLPYEGERIGYRTIPDCLEAADRGEVNYAIVPIENSIEGSVNQSIDWLIHEVNLTIWAEVVLPIHHGLYVHPRNQGLPFSEIEKIYSHPQAIAQTHRYLRKELSHAEVEFMPSTSEACRLVYESPDKPWAAIGNRRAANLYHLVSRAEEIQDYEENHTRFLMVGREEPSLPPSPKRKTTILVTLGADFPGALHQVLSCFSWRKINLSRIESRPTKKGLGSYHFFIDIERPMDAILLPSTFAEIEALGCKVRFLGSYPVYESKE
ncbi:Prephenate dehydratase [[Clostridium] ultunense Esp]|uniref:prephenate dehydratase n=1 Tax=Thermicanus aegyptius TaxID=94009 RepID=UPI0002B6FA5A|nr:prephenate dehydratase [Thermicanus aegyptius]CCQ94159.1 Prephenate dehydratase [[Clostridium] ultunense Esp]